MSWEIKVYSVYLISIIQYHYITTYVVYFTAWLIFFQLKLDMHCFEDMRANFLVFIILKCVLMQLVCRDLYFWLSGTGWLMYTSEVYLDESLIFLTTLIKSVLLQQETGKLYIFCAWLHEWCLLMDPVFLHNPCYSKLYSSNQTRRTKYLKFSSIIKQEHFILSSTQLDNSKTVLPYKWQSVFQKFIT